MSQAVFLAYHVVSHSAWEDVVKIISDETLRIAYIKINLILTKTEEIATSNVSSNNRCWESMVNIVSVNAEVDLIIIINIANKEKMLKLIKLYKPNKTKDAGLKMEILHADENLSANDKKGFL